MKLDSSFSRSWKGPSINCSLCIFCALTPKAQLILGVLLNCCLIMNVICSCYISGCVLPLACPSILILVLAACLAWGWVFNHYSMLHPNDPQFLQGLIDNRGWTRYVYCSFVLNSYSWQEVEYDDRIVAIAENGLVASIETVPSKAASPTTRSMPLF